MLQLAEERDGVELRRTSKKGRARGGKLITSSSGTITFSSPKICINLKDASAGFSLNLQG